MERQQIIQSIIDKINAETYLEIGVQRGKLFYDISAPRKIAVDPKFKIGIQRRLKNLHQFFKQKFYEMTSDDFFAHYAKKLFSQSKIDVAMIDGLHTYEQVMKDFKNCLNHLSQKGFIVFHDCNPETREAAEYAHSPEEVMSKFPGKTPEWNGDVWKAIVQIRKSYPDIEVMVLDCDYGVGVARRNPGRTSRLSVEVSDVEALTYDDLEKNRKEFLNLKPYSFWKDYIANV